MSAEEVSDEMIMPFGKYKGEKVANVPASYLLFLHRGRKGLYGTLGQYVKENYDLLVKESGENEDD